MISTLLALLPLAQSGDLALPTETYVLDNGMQVTLHVDHSLPKVVINTWYAVGSKDETHGRTGFAHLFEHLMFMGTGRVPGSDFDVIMESGGGFNNATTSQDRTNYYSQGPSSLLPTLLWLDADRFEALDDFMTQEKLDAQRAIVRNERRQSGENVPYGRAYLLMPGLLYPEGHPYRHPVIGSHEDLEAASVEDVVEFFRTYYVPANASLVVAGDFDPAVVKPLIERTLGSVPPQPVPARKSAKPAVLSGEIRAVTYDDVELAKLMLTWPSPAFMTDGDAALDMLAAVLAGGPATRLERRLVIETGMAQEVEAYQSSGELGSEFTIEVLAKPGTDLETIRREVLDVVAGIRGAPGTANGAVRETELARVKVQFERDFLQRNESLLSRADAINRYLHYWGVADGFQRDLDRYAALTPGDLSRWAGRVLGAGLVDLRVLPAEGRETGTIAAKSGAAAALWRPGGSLDNRPNDLARQTFVPPTPSVHKLSNGIPVYVVTRPGTKLFAGELLVRGGESVLPSSRAGLASLTARMLNQGAAGKDTVTWAEEVESLGASIRASSERENLSVGVSGLTSRMSETLDRFAQTVFEPNLTATDFERERGLVLGDIQTRGDNPRAVAGLVVRALAFGADAYRGRPVEGHTETVQSFGLDDVVGAYGILLPESDARFVFVGDFDEAQLLSELEARFRDFQPKVAARAGRSAAFELVRAQSPILETPLAGSIVLVDRPGAPQTVISILRPLALPTDDERALRTALDVALGGSFTSRLNMNLRERNGYSYGAGSRITREGEQVTLAASSAVFTDKTGVALAEFRKEFAGISSGNVSAEELAKALESSRTDTLEGFSTTRSIARSIAALVTNGRRLDAPARDLKRLDGVRLAAANELAGSGLYDWSQLLVVLVGDAEQILPQLEEAGFDTPLRADPEGRILE